MAVEPKSIATCSNGITVNMKADAQTKSTQSARRATVSRRMASGEMTHHGVADFWLCDVWSGQSLMEGCRRALGMTARYPGRGQGRAASAQAAARELLRVLVEIRRRRMQA
jgi:hypothetical protein